MRNKVIIFLLVAIATITNAQNVFTAKVLDSNNNEYKNNTIYGCSVLYNMENSNMSYTECLICHCNPKPDEWSGQVMGVCIDCG